MSQRMTLGFGLAVPWIVIAALWHGGGCDRDRPPPAAPATAPAAAPATAPTSAAARRQEKPAEYFDIVRLRHPSFATTQPMMIPVSLAEAARLVLDDPIYLDFNGELWITRSDADSTVNVLKTSHQRSTHVLRERVVFVHRWPDDSGQWQPHLIVAKPDRNGWEVVTRAARQDLGGDYSYDWTRAFSWNDAIVVPTDRGVSVIRPDRRPMESHHDFISPEQFRAAKYSQVQALLDWRGLIAWIPWENGLAGSSGAARFIDGKWVKLDPAAGWPEKLQHIVPLLDGGILQLVVRQDEAGQDVVEVAMASLDPPQVDEKKIVELVDQLSDPDSLKRVAAFNELTRFGSGIWPLLEQVLPDQPPEAQIRIGQLLSAKTEPMLGGMRLLPGPVTVLARADSGGAVMLYSDAGVTIAREGGVDPYTVTPALISIEPDRPIDLAPPALASELQVKGRSLSIVRGEWIVNDDAEGPRWWLSNHLTAPLLKGEELDFKHLLGQDRRGRWLFRRSRYETSPTFIIDPTLPDSTPRLPVWTYAVEGGQAGWTIDDWPAIKRGGAWALVNADWKPINESKGEKFLTAADRPPDALPVESPTTAPTTIAASGPSTRESSGPPILVEPDGTRFFDGIETLRMVSPDGKDVTWPLPAEAVGTGEQVYLLRAGENRLFLFNGPGRLLRIRPTPGEAEPFALEAAFTRKIPNVDRPDRIWVDPAGRLIIAYDSSALAICFPAGRIPPEIARKMTAADLKEAEE